MNKEQVLKEMWNEMLDKPEIGRALAAGKEWALLGDPIRLAVMAAFDAAYDNIHGED